MASESAGVTATEQAVDVSVVIPTYNGASFIGNQLEALCSQDFVGSFEVLVADNGSQDNTMEIATTFSSRLRLRVLDASSRKGGAAARNIGAAESRGGALAFLDQDDQAAADWLRKVANALDTADVVVGLLPFMGSQEASYRPLMTGTYAFLPYGLSANMSIRREVLTRLGGFDESFPAASDLDLCWRAQLAGHCLTGIDAVVWKRRKETLSGAWRQHLTFGVDDVRLYTRFRAHGMPRYLVGALKSWAWLATRLFCVLIRRFDRDSWIRLLAQRIGRLRGSVQMRVFYP